MEEYNFLEESPFISSDEEEMAFGHTENTTFLIANFTTLLFSGNTKYKQWIKQYE